MSDDSCLAGGVQGLHFGQSLRGGDSYRGPIGGDDSSASQPGAIHSSEGAKGKVGNEGEDDGGRG